jgi:nuclear pore complex protein Nup62
MIETVNSLSSIPDSTSGGSGSGGGAASPFANGGAGNDPISQIEAILNAHLASLQWIDGAVKELESKVREVEIQQDNSSDAYSSSYGGDGGGHRRGFGLGPR